MCTITIGFACESVKSSYGVFVKCVPDTIQVVAITSLCPSCVLQISNYHTVLVAMRLYCMGELLSLHVIATCFSYK